MTLEVKVMEVPGRIISVALQEGATVQDALTAAEMTLASGRVLKVSGMNATLDTELQDGDNITMSANAKGNT